MTTVTWQQGDTMPTFTVRPPESLVAAGVVFDGSYTAKAKVSGATAVTFLLTWDETEGAYSYSPTLTESAGFDVGVYSVRYRLEKEAAELRIPAKTGEIRCVPNEFDAPP